LNPTGLFVSNDRKKELRFSEHWKNEAGSTLSTAEFRLYGKWVRDVEEYGRQDACGTEEAGRMPAVRKKQASPGCDAREVRYGRSRQDARGAGEAGRPGL
jgi:hypothetical protein